MGCRKCLPLSVVQLKGKHCQNPHCRNGVVDTFGQCGFLNDYYKVNNWRIPGYHNNVFTYLWVNIAEVYPNVKLFPIYKWQFDAISSFATIEEILSKGAEQLGGKRWKKRLIPERRRRRRKGQLFISKQLIFV